MEKTKVSVQGVPETMLQTLYARASESQKPNHHIYDEKAIKVVSQMDYDFTKASNDNMMRLGVIARTIVLDQLVEDYLQHHPQTLVINIACGMDTRCYRVKASYSRWYNVDLPETMQIRQTFFKEEGPIYQIAKSATDASFLDEVEYNGEPVLIIIEGLTMYLSEQDVKTMFSILDRKFSNAQILVETMSPFFVKTVKEKSIEGSQAQFTWGIKNGAQLHTLLPNFHNVKDVSLVEGMKVLMPIYHILGIFPFVRNISNKILVMQKETLSSAYSENPSIKNSK